MHTSAKQSVLKLKREKYPYYIYLHPRSAARQDGYFTEENIPSPSPLSIRSSDIPISLPEDETSRSCAIPFHSLCIIPSSFLFHIPPPLIKPHQIPPYHEKTPFSVLPPHSTEYPTPLVSTHNYIVYIQASSFNAVSPVWSCVYSRQNGRFLALCYAMMVV